MSDSRSNENRQSGQMILCLDAAGVLDQDYFFDAEEQVVYDAQLAESSMMDKIERDDNLHLPVASATLLEPLIAPIDDSPPTQRYARLSFDAADPTVDALVSYSRPEFVFVSALVPRDNENKVGLSLKKRPEGGGTLVSGVANDSPFVNSNLHPGDHLVAVNNVLCSHLNPHQVAKLIKGSKGGKVSICFHNQRGDPSLISCSVQKPDPSTKVGVALRKKRDAVRVTRVDKDGLFGNSLLMPHHRCMMINGISCAHMSSKTAGELIGMSSDRVTIISRPEASYALTIALEEHTQWWKKLAIGGIGVGLAAGAVGTIQALS